MAGLIDPRLVKVRAGRRGSGWAVGSCGVLTARHVVEPFLDGKSEDGTKVDWCVAVLDPSPDAAAFACDVIWHDQDRDLALLRVREDGRPKWTLAIAHTSAPVLAEPGEDAVVAQAVGYPVVALEGTQPAPELVPGMLMPPGGVLSGRMPFVVNTSVPETSKMWQGMSGAAVRDSHGRLLGVVVAVDEQHQQRRFYVATLPDPALDVLFGQALTAVDALPLLEASTAPANRELLAILDPAGRPYTAAGMPELSNFRVRLSRTDIDTHGDPYYPYVRRDLDQVLSDALDRRVNGTERRALLLVGDAMAGKSRMLAEALRRHPVIADWPILIPRHNAELRQVVQLAATGHGVMWLDDVNAYTTGLDEAIHALAATPGVIIAATLRTDRLQKLQDDPDRRVAWDVLTSSWLVEQLTVEPGWTDAERMELDSAESMIQEALQRGRPLGEVLGAADELRKRLAAGNVKQKALAFVVADWPRTGLPPSLPEDLARQLWPTHLSPPDAADLTEKPDEDIDREFLEARSWACQKVAGAAALLRRTRDGSRCGRLCGSATHL